MILSTVAIFFGIVNFLLLVWLIMIVNNAFSFTNKNIDNMSKKSELLILKADEVIAKYKRITIEIENSK